MRSSNKSAVIRVRVSKASGQGAAILLDFSFGDYANTAAGPGQMQIGEVARRVIDGAGVAHNWRATHPDMSPLIDGRVSAFARGKAKVVALLPARPADVKEPVPLRVQVPAAAHIYDLRQGTYLGKGAAVSVSSLYTSATVLSALPYRVSKLTVTAPAKSVAGAACPVQIALTAEGDVREARPVFRINVIGPDGQDRHYYARTLCPSGLQAKMAIPFALSDSPGEWQVVARDVLTGTRTITRVRLEAGQ